MSFIKELFEKRKDSKYGKGHRLGDVSQPARNDLERSRIQPGPSGSQSQSEAARKAGEAALQRLQSANKTQKRPLTSSIDSKIKEDIINQEKELQKALELKDHYFGKQTVIDNVSTVNMQKIYFRSSVLPPGERYPLNEIEDKIEQSLLQQLDEEPILVSVSLLFTANYKNQEKLEKCVEILNKFVDNILNSPNEEKYRKIRLENQIFKEKVYSCKYADMVLKKSGFQPKLIKNSDNLEEDYFVYDGMNLEKLENLKTALSLAEPITPELDRDLRIFKISNNTSSTVINDFSLSDEFFNLKIEELRKEQILRNDAIEKAGMLRTKAMRERDEQLELRRYNYCLIRVRFPDNFILQALFKSNEKYEDFYNFIQNTLEMEALPFDLVGHSLKKPANGSNMLSSTLAEVGLAPSALLNFKLADSVDDRVKSCIKYYLKLDLLKQAEML